MRGPLYLCHLPADFPIRLIMMSLSSAYTALLGTVETYLIDGFHGLAGFDVWNIAVPVSSK